MKIKVTDRSAYITEDEIFVSGSVAEYTVQFEFTGAWAGYTKTAVFKTTDGGTIQDVLLGELNTAVVPWEVLEEPGYIQIGIYGMKGGQARPTLWVGPKYVEPGAEPYDRATYPASTPWADALEAVTDAEADAEEAAEDSEAYAKGTRNGEAVTSDDPAYHNNAKYYAEQAGDANTAAQSAKTAAQEAAASASAAYGTDLLGPNFVEGTGNDPGEYVIYSDGKMYLLPDGHTAGTTWANTNKIKKDVGGELSDLKSAIDKLANTNNLFVDAAIHDGFYGMAPGDSADYSYFEVPVVNGKTYHFTSACRFISKSGEILETNVAPGETYLADFTGTLYVTVYNDYANHGGEWAMYEDGTDPDTIGTYQHPALAPHLMAQELGTSKVSAMSQAAVKTIIDPMQRKIANIINNDNLFIDAPLVPNHYYYTTEDYNTVYSYFKVPVVSGTKYYFGCDCRYLSKSGTILAHSIVAGGSYTVDYTGTLYVTVYNDTASHGEWAMCVDGVDITAVGSYQQITLSPGIIRQEQGTSKNAVMSQNATTDLINTIRNDHNLFNSAVLTRNKYYYTKEDGSTTYSYFQVPVTNGVTYRFACKQRYISKAGEILLQNGAAGNTFTPDYTGILYVSVYNDTANNGLWAMTENAYDPFAAGDYQKYTIAEHILAQEYGTDKSKSVSQKLLDTAIKDNGFILSKGFARATGDLSTGESLILTKTNVKKNNIYAFCAKISTFGSIKIGQVSSAYESNYIEIDATNLTVYKTAPSSGSASYPHGLTITDYINAMITVGEGKATISIYSNNEEFTKTDVDWYGDGDSAYSAKCVAGSLTDCIFTWGSNDFRKRLWVFGDSYLSFANGTRWPYYLKENGYLNNVLLNAFSGENSNDAVAALNGCAQYGAPKFIIWSMGMNDLTDSGGQPATRWKNGIDSLIAYCQEARVTPILCTIPSVPSVNNAEKNAWVRNWAANNNGRYIDFAKAVENPNYDSSTDAPIDMWYSGMLNPGTEQRPDYVHPTALGAKALYYRAIADCPELTFES